MTELFRLQNGGRIDRSRAIAFRFNGRTLSARPGDTVASALLANGQHLVGRSFKYHRPRGILAAGSEEPNALLDVDRGRDRRDPNNRAAVVEVFDGMSVTTQNHWPSLGFDAAAVNDVLSPMLPAGFYYKTFLWPASFWKNVYEPMIRRIAGLGVAPEVPDPERYAHRHGHTEVLVVGTGPAGLAAALAASSDPAKRVLIVDEQAEPGGALLHDATSVIDGKPAAQWLAWAIATLDQRQNVTLMPRTTAFGYFNHNHIALVERLTDHQSHPLKGLPRERLWQIRAGEVILATGAHERPLLFANNDRPGIMLADAVRTYINRYAVAPGRKLVVVTSSSSAYATALDARAAGLDVTLIDLRREDDIGPEARSARAASIEVLAGYGVLGARGIARVTALEVAPVDRTGDAGRPHVIPCDCVAMSGGWTPAIHLFSQSRGKLTFDGGLDAFVPGAEAQPTRSAGACRGTYELAGCLAEGASAGGRPQAYQATTTLTRFVPAREISSPPQRSRGKAFVDFQNDVTDKDIKIAVGEGFESVEHIKRYTTTGMATDQGKTSNMNALGLASDALGKSVPHVGLTTFRLPYTPVTFGALAGANRDALFDPARLPPSHNWAAMMGARFEDVGQWKRAWYFPKPAEDIHMAVARETRAVRSVVGLFDASTLGKIEVVGPDAAQFMNLLYTNAWTKLEPGRCRYGLMLKEDGMIMDDGVVARLAADRFHVTTTTGGAARVMAHMEDYLQTEFPHLKVFLTSITEQWAVIAVQGPLARDIIAPFVTDIDLSNAAFPHMSVRTGHFAGVPCRLFRVSFTGELGYEINVPSDYGLAVWEAIYEHGKPQGLTPYGTESMHVLRAEKGYIIVGQETDGTMTPDDVGLGGMVTKSKSDFVGKRSLERLDLVAAGRPQLVGLLTDDPDTVLDEGAQVVDDPDQSVPMVMLGHVTSSYFSANLERSIALAVVKGGRARVGEQLHVTTPTGFAMVSVVEPVFLDAEGARVHA
jgi:sarcosine oxidase subunit alpha